MTLILVANHKWQSFTRYWSKFYRVKPLIQYKIRKAAAKGRMLIESLLDVSWLKYEHKAKLIPWSGKLSAHRFSIQRDVKEKEKGKHAMYTDVRTMDKESQFCVPAFSTSIGISYCCVQNSWKADAMKPHTIWVHPHHRPYSYISVSLPWQEHIFKDGYN